MGLIDRQIRREETHVGKRALPTSQPWDNAPRQGFLEDGPWGRRLRRTRVPG